MSIAGYWMQVFPLPKSIIRRIDSICKNFLWSSKATGRKAFVAWENACQPKNARVSITYLTNWNKATLIKML